MIRAQRPFALWLFIVASIILVLAGLVVFLKTTRKPTTAPPITLTFDGAGVPRWHGVPLANTNVRDAVFETMSRVGLKAGLTVPTNAVTNNAQRSNLVDVLQAMGRAGLFSTNSPANPNPYE
jgi:hypothetical protein